MRADVGDDASVTALVDKACERFGRIDIMISNASALAVTDDRASWDASLNVDVMGAVRLVEAVLPLMKAEGGGSILLVSSISAIEAAPMEDFGYTAAKAALNAYAKKLAVVEGSHGIRANALLPGSTEFPGGGWEMMRDNNPSIYEMSHQGVPLGRSVQYAICGFIAPRCRERRPVQGDSLMTRVVICSTLCYAEISMD